MIKLTLLVLVGVAVCRAGKEGIVCPKGITTFAYNQDNTHYWFCPKVGVKALLRECRSGTMYDRKSGICIKKLDEGRLSKRGAAKKDEEVEVVEMESTGNSPNLGQTYNMRTGKLIPGQYAWRRSTTNKHKVIKPLLYSNMDIFQEQDVNTRAYHMSVEASLKLGFLSGMINVEGTAKYLRDEKESSNVARVTMKYRSTRESETMPVKIALDDMSICKEAQNADGPTHVVTARVFGTRAYINFDRRATEMETTEEIGGSLKVSIDAIPSFKIEGKAWIDIKGHKVKNIDNVKISYYGDAYVGNPETYLLAVKAIADVQKTSLTSTVAIKYQLTPLQYLCSDTEVKLMDMGSELVDRTIEVLTELVSTNLKVQALKKTDVSTRSNTIRQVLDKFSSELDSFTTSLKQDVKILLPKLRAGDPAVSEADLANLIAKYEASAFSLNKADLFLELRAREINTIELVISHARGSPKFEITDASSADANSCLMRSRFATVYNLKVLPLTNAAEKFIEDKEVGDESGAWFNDLEKVGRAGGMLKDFIRDGEQNFVKNLRCFIIRVSPMVLDDPNYVFLKMYADAQVKTSNFVVPGVPPTPVCRPKFDGFEIISAESGNAFVTKNIVKAGKWNPAKNDTEYQHGENPDQQIIRITGLRSRSAYNISTKYQVYEYNYEPLHERAGFSVPSTTVLCTTAPSTEISNLRVSAWTKSQLTMSWDQPSEKDPFLKDNELEYVVKLRKDGAAESEVVLARTTRNTHTFENLAPGTKYEISVHTETSNRDSYSLPTTTTFSTATGVIPTPEVNIIRQTDAKFAVKLSLLRLPAQTKAKSLKITYYEVDNVKFEEIKNTRKYQTINLKDFSDLKFEVKPLVGGKSYQLFVQLTTSFGTDRREIKSDTTGPITFTTPFGGTEADKMTEEFESIKSKTNTRINNVDKKANSQISKLDQLNSQLNSFYSAQINALNAAVSAGNANFTYTDNYLSGMAREMCVEQSMEFYEKSALYTSTKYNLFDCYDSCRKRSDCESISYSTSTKKCTLKRKRTGDMKQDSKDVISINKVCYEALSSTPGKREGCIKHNTDYNGADIKSSASVNTFSDCINWCLFTPTCKSVTYQAASDSCWLKNRAEGASKRGGSGLQSLTISCL